MKINRLKDKIFEREQLYKALFDFIPEAVLVIHNYSIIDCNPKALELFNCDYDQIIEKPISFISPNYQSDNRDSAEELNRYIKTAINNKTTSCEWEHCKYDGTIFKAEISLKSLDISNNKYILWIV